MTESMIERVESAALDRQIPFPSPESVVANVLCRDANGERPSRQERRLAQRITNALRAAGWRVLR